MKKILALVLALTMLMAVCLSGCGSAKADTSAPGAEARTTDSTKKIEINYWFCIGSALEAVVQGQIDDFNASQDRIHVTGTFQGYYGDTSAKIQQALVAGTQPEIVMLERATVPQYNAVGALEDLTPYMECDDFDINDFNQGLMNFSVYDGKVVSLPLNRSTPIMFYNKNAFVKAGLDPEAPPTTWDEMLEIAAKLTIKEGDTVKQYGIEFPVDTFVFQSLIPQAGGTLLNDDLTDIGFNNTSGLAAFEYLMALRDTGVMKIPPAQDSYTVTKQDFYNGVTAMMIESTAALRDSINATEGKFEIGTAFLPGKDTYAVQTGGGNIAVLSACDQEKKDAAWEFIKFMYSEESGSKFVVDTGYIPVTNTIMNSKAVQDVWAKYPQYQVAYDQLQYVVEPGQHENWSQINTVINNDIQAVLFENKLTPQQALDDISAQAVKILK